VNTHVMLTIASLMLAVPCATARGGAPARPVKEVKVTQIPEAYGDRIAIHPDGIRFATAEGSGVRLFEGEREVEVFDLDDAFGLTFSRNGKRLYAAPSVIDLMTRKARELPNPTAAFAGKEGGWELTGAVMPPDGKVLLIAASRGGGDTEGSERVLLLDPIRRAVLRDLWRGSDRHATLAVGKTYLAAAFTDILLWRRKGSKGPRSLTHHRAMVTALTFHRAALASGDATGALAVWDAAHGRLVASTQTAHAGDVHAIAWDPDGKRLWTGGEDGRLRAWTPQLKPTGPSLAAFDGPVQAIAVAPDGASVLVAIGAPNHRLLRLTLK